MTERRQFDVVVASAGGAGTTTMLRFLTTYLATNHWNSFEDGLKHANRPSHPIFAGIDVQRALYLVADPREVVLSLFRRDYAPAMPAKIASEHDSVESYGTYVRANRREGYDLATFLDDGFDSFGFEDHWRNWTTGAHEFPIMIVNYESLPGSLVEIAEFLGLPKAIVDEFPEWHQRASSLSAVEPTAREQLDRIYGDLAAVIAGFPAIAIRR